MKKKKSSSINNFKVNQFNSDLYPQSNIYSSLAWKRLKRKCKKHRTHGLSLTTSVTSPRTYNEIESF